MNRSKPRPKSNESAAAASTVSPIDSLVVVWISPEITQFYQPGSADSLGLEACISSGIDRIPDSALVPYFDEIQRKLSPFKKVAILGPDMTKFHFRTYLQEQIPDLFRKICAFETVGRPNSALGAAYLQKYASRE